MDKKSVVLAPKAREDIIKIAAIYKKLAGVDYARRITKKLNSTIATLVAGSILPDNELAIREYRRLVCEDYICIYKVYDDKVIVLRIVNGRTNYPELMK